jgi:hypothetical protein
VKCCDFDNNEVDLTGRLSNPRPVVEILVEQGSQGSRPRQTIDGTQNRASVGSFGADREEEGRLSNLVQRRLPEDVVDKLASAYLAGSPIDALAAKLGVSRTTIISHLDNRGVERRKAVRKMTGRSVRRAAKHYEGASPWRW